VKEICPVGSMLTHADRWSNGQMDMTHEIGPFSDYANMTKSMVKTIVIMRIGQEDTN
jgi:hypothetical protein